MYKDGVYEVETLPDYEGYYAKARLTIKDDIITDVDWCIYDSNRNNRPFDDTYGEVFKEYPLYVKQCIDDWNGSKEYGPKLIGTQDLQQVDAVSGATWTNNVFKAVVDMALEKAKI